MANKGIAGGALPTDPDVLEARARVEQAFAEGGDFCRAIDGFVVRASQREMALAVFDTITERATLLAEAGTGTGKTFGYLAPALIAGGRVLVSVGTRALQDQVFARDLDAVRRALGLRLETALLKGRQNYVCRLRLASAEGEAQAAGGRAYAQWRAVARFSETSTTGDRSELGAVPENAAIWPDVTSTRETCTGAECRHFDACFVYRARRRALAADVVVVNHHLFLADLALKDDAVNELLPIADTVILDEAHQLPRIASEFFGHGWSLRQVSELARDARVLGLRAAADDARWATSPADVEAALRPLRLALAQSGVPPGTRVALGSLAGTGALAAAMRRLSDHLATLAAVIQAHEGRDPELDLLAPRAAHLRSEIDDWASTIAGIPSPPRHGRDDAAPASDNAEDDDAEVRWIAATQTGAQFHATPLVPGAAFARARARQAQAWILTSATLTVGGRFDAYAADIGLPVSTQRRWESPFDFPRQACLYLPPYDGPDAAIDGSERVADCAWPLIRAAGGRAFVLCSTLRAVERVASRLQALAASDDMAIRVLQQGTATRSALLDDFRRNGDAVLVGSVSFWEGIDVQGEALTLVVIDRIPFAPPDDPVVAARIRRLRSLGRNPFLEYQLPEAVTLLRQGAGRLIRGERDRGVLVIVDERILTKSYGKTILASLPPFTRSRDVEVARAFLEPPSAR
ncbi:MAG TPA: ATP-dependent DNA helicase [Burkholderiaceae bacterium]|nr:ATP-dependent DNA helicase [Burkholderiaceae bacterium]